MSYLDTSEFEVDNFDIKSYTSSIIKTQILGEHLAKLTQSINLLDKQIRDQVNVHHEDLINQAVHIETLEDNLNMVQARILSIKNTSERLCAKISSPFNELQLRITQLSRLQMTCDYLRKIKGIIHHTTKLRAQMSYGLKEIVKAAQTLNELDFLLKDFDANGIEIVADDIQFIEKSRVSVEEQANSLLEIGLQSQNQTQIGTALNVFLNIGSLVNKLNLTLKQFEHDFTKVTYDYLNPVQITLKSTTSSSSGQPGGSTMPMIGSMSQFRATLWSNIEKLFDKFYDLCSKCVQLQKILLKKKDFLTYNTFLANTDEIELNKMLNKQIWIFNADDDRAFQTLMIDLEGRNSIEFLWDVWKILCGHLQKSFHDSLNQSNHIKQTLQNEYPKLLKLKNEFWSRIVQLHPFIEKFVYEKQTAFGLFHRIFIDLESFYINRSLESLFDSINFIFSTQNPSQLNTSIFKLNRDDLDKFVKSIQTELTLLQYDTKKTQADSFSLKIIKNLSKAIQMYSNKYEQVMQSAPSGFNTTPTQENLSMIECVNVSYELYERLKSLFSSISNEALSDSLEQSLLGVINSSLSPLITYTLDCVDAILLTMHNEDQTYNQQTSLYLKELHQVLSRIAKDYFSLYQCKSLLNQNLREVASNTLELFIRQASLVRPMNKYNLLQETNQIEQAISPICSKINDLGTSYKKLKAFKTLLQITELSDGCQVYIDLSENLNTHTILHYLYSSFAPEDLKSPHETHSWSIARYSQWLDKHTSEKDKLLFIQDCLHDYLKYIQENNKTQFAHVYPVMMSVLEHGLKVLQSFD